MKLLRIFLFWNLILFCSLSAEVVVFKSGKSIEGKIIEQNTQSITIIDKKGTKSKLLKSNVFKVLFSNNEKDRQKAEESAKAFSEKEKIQSNPANQEEFQKLEEERMAELESILEKNKVPLASQEEGPDDLKKRIAQLESRVLELEEFTSKDADWRRYNSDPRSPWDIVSRSSVIPGWGHRTAKEDSIGNTYTTLFFSSLALYLASEEAIQKARTSLTADAINKGILEPILFTQLISGSSSGAGLSTIRDTISAQNAVGFQKNYADFEQLKQTSGRLEQFTIGIYFIQLTHAYLTGRTWTNALLDKQKDRGNPVSFQFQLRPDRSNFLGSRAWEAEFQFSQWMVFP
jgi:curved DNA-binding protein CbpA